MSKMGKKLIKAAKQAAAIARGDIDAANKSMIEYAEKGGMTLDELKAELSRKK